APPQPPGSGDEAGLEAEEGLAKADTLARAEDEDSHAQALQSDQAAVASFHKAGDGIGEGDALLQLGAHQDQFGHKREALETLAAARTLWTSLDQSYGAAVAAAQLGQINSEMGENATALPLFEEALVALRALGARRWESSVLSGMGDAYQELG